MKTTAVVAAMSLLTLSGAAIGYSVFAQDNRKARGVDPSAKALDDSDDPSIVAARDALSVINEFGKIEETVKAEEDRETPSPTTWPAAPDISDWAGHYLVLQGENYLPVRQAFATPVVTIYEIEKGYIPHGPFSRVKSNNSLCDAAPADADVGGGASVSSAIATDVAETTGSDTADRSGLMGCPKRLGVVWGAGSYVVDENGENLAGQEFSDGVKLFHGRDLSDGDEDDEDSGFLVIFEGGPERMGDPAITPLPWSTAILIDYPVRVTASGSVDEGGLKENPYTQAAFDLPVTVLAGRPLHPSGETGTDRLPLEELLEMMVEVLEAGLKGYDGDEAGYLLIHRGDPALEDSADRERLRRIRDRISQYGTVRTLSFGQEAPICKDDTDACWSINRSTFVYRVR